MNCADGMVYVPPGSEGCRAEQQRTEKRQREPLSLRGITWLAQESLRLLQQRRAA